MGRKRATGQHRRRRHGEIDVAFGPHRDQRFALGAAEFASRDGWTLNVLPMRLGEIASYTLVDSAGIIGVFGPGHDEHLARARATGLPLVSVGTPPTDALIPAVCPDYRAIGRLAAEHLVEHGYRRLSVVTDVSTPMGAAYAAGAISAATRANVELAFLDYYADDWLAALCNGAPPTGIFACSDTTAKMLIERLLHAGVRIPDEAGVIGAGNEELLCICGRASITSVDPDHQRVGYEAAKLMDAILRGRRPPKSPVLVPPKGIVVRGSTDYFALGHPEAHAAMRYLREHFREPITSSEVAEAAGVSRVHLDAIFRAGLGRTVTQEILRRRVAAAAERLTGTDEKCETIARRCGFSSVQTLSRAFKRVMGSSPQHYRRTHHRNA